MSSEYDINTNERPKINLEKDTEKQPINESEFKDHNITLSSDSLTVIGIILAVIFGLSVLIPICMVILFIIFLVLAF